jgi:uncharacterized ion transporter superfamily protein YfcC
MVGLSLAGVSYNKYAKVALPFIGVLLLTALLLLLIGGISIGGTPLFGM